MTLCSHCKQEVHLYFQHGMLLMFDDLCCMDFHQCKKRESVRENEIDELINSVQKNDTLKVTSRKKRECI